MLAKEHGTSIRSPPNLFKRIYKLKGHPAQAAVTFAFGQLGADDEGKKVHNSSFSPELSFSRAVGRKRSVGVQEVWSLLAVPCIFVAIPDVQQPLKGE